MLLPNCDYYLHDSGIIFQLEPSVFELLSRLEKKMSRVIKSVGNIEHEVYPALPNYLNAHDCVVREVHIAIPRKG